jgi:2-(1,2-epoxy-1,2-dihydrophenyl)acetyl-CoA isomerase
MAHAFLERCKQVAADDSVRVVVIAGNGAGFGVGGDLGEMREDPPRIASELIACMHEAVQLLTSLDAPVIASLHGSVAGGSLSLAMACDLAIAADNASFNLAYVNLGTSCDLSGSWHLPRLVGLRNAMAIALLGESFGAQEAHRLGLVNQVVPQVALQAATAALAQRLAQGPREAMGRIKRLLRGSLNHDLARQMELEGENFRACAASADFREGLEAFFGKREAVFSGG